MHIVCMSYTVCYDVLLAMRRKILSCVYITFSVPWFAQLYLLAYLVRKYFISFY